MENTQSNLSLEAQQLIRRYMISLIALPGVIIVIISFAVGFFVNDVAIGKGRNDAFSRYSDNLIEMTRRIARDQKIIANLQEKHEAIDILLDQEKKSLASLITNAERAIERVDSASTIVEKIQSGEGTDSLKKSILAYIKNDPDFIRNILTDVSDRIAKLERISKRNMNRLNRITLDVQCHLSGIGDRNVKNGEFCGTRGQDRQMEGVQVRLTIPPHSD